MKLTEYCLASTPQVWSGISPLHADGCVIMPDKNQLRAIGQSGQALTAMRPARKIHRRAQGSAHCCKACMLHRNLGTGENRPVNR